MLKRDYFLKSLAAGNYRFKRWVLESFSITRPSAIKEDEFFQFRLERDREGLFFFKDEEGNIESISDSIKDEPLFKFKEELKLEKGEIANLTEGSIITTYGNALFNQMVLVYAFGSKIEYMQGPVTVSRIEKIIEKYLIDEPKPDDKVDPKALFVSEYKAFNEAIFALAGFSQLSVPSATKKAMTVDPRIAIRREELLEKYKDKLDDPVIQAQIEVELKKMDREWLKGDEAEGFYISNKSYDIVRKKLFLFQGTEQGFGVKGNFIPTSLDEGWKVKDLPAMGNSLRDGSFGRGALTALGGEATKFNYRIFQNTTIAEEDCGSNMGITISLTESNASSFISSSVLEHGKPILLTDENISEYIGKRVLIRSPIHCWTLGSNFCAVCMGKNIASTPNAISTFAADIGSTFMSISLKSFHGKALSIAEFDINTDLD